MEEINNITICRDCRKIFKGIAQINEKKELVCPHCSSDNIVLATACVVIDWLIPKTRCCPE
ncbi:MAG: hypothetical protein GY874_06010 [Desulfobacteraceae bacterium]|nr:hypothetical protein [Desulfobacteraceae bacterium]